MPPADSELPGWTQACFHPEHSSQPRGDSAVPASTTGLTAGIPTHAHGQGQNTHPCLCTSSLGVHGNSSQTLRHRQVLVVGFQASFHLPI